MPRVNWDSVKDEGGCNIPPEGEGIFRVKSSEEKTSAAGNEMFEIILVGDDARTRGTQYREWLTFTEAALWKVKQFCSAAGVATVGNMDLRPNMLQGRRVKSTIYHEKSENGYINAKSSYYESAIRTGPKTTEEIAGPAREPVHGEEEQQALRDFGLDDDPPF